MPMSRRKARLRVNADQLSVDKTYAHNDQEFDQIIRFLDEKGP